MLNRQWVLVGMGFIALSICPVATAEAEWIANGVPVCTAYGPQDSVVICNDGSGGGVIVWEDGRGGYTRLYAQRVDGEGNTLWAHNGVCICPQPGHQIHAQVVRPAEGDFVIVWQDSRNGNWDIYAQRLDAWGVPVWPMSGAPVCENMLDQTDPVMVCDESGGVIVAWWDRRCDAYDIYAQRIDPWGYALWVWGGVPVYSSGTKRSAEARLIDNPELLSCKPGSGGMIVIWEDWRYGPGHSDIVAQRMDNDGTALWDPYGETVCGADGRQFGPGAVADGDGGVYITWWDRRYNAYDIYAQRADSKGTSLWTPDGVEVFSLPTQTPSSRLIDNPELLPCKPGSGGMIVVWEDRRNGLEDQDIYAQSVDEWGGILWPTEGVGICTSPGLQCDPAVIADEDSGFIVAWSDTCDGYDNDCCVQRSDGVTVCDAEGAQTLPQLAPDGKSGAIVTWVDDRSGGDRDIYAQLVTADGLTGDQATEVAVTPSWNSVNTLSQNSPNPCNPATRIAFTTERQGRVSLKIFDVTGRWVRTLVDGNLEARFHEVVWDGTDAGGHRVAPGVYLYRLDTAGWSAAKRMVVAR